MSTFSVSNPTDTVMRLWRRAPFIVFALLLILAYFLFLMLYLEPAISTPDANGYFAQAKLIAKEGRTYLEPESILQYIGPHWLPASNNHYYTTFPPGFPIILSVVYKIVGPKASLLVNPLMAALSLLGLFLLCRSWIGAGWGLLAMLLMAFNPFANEHALFGDSHTSVVFFIIWGLFFLIQWSKTGSEWRIFIAGIFFGIIPTLRYPEFLFLIAFVIFVLLHSQKSKVFWRSLISGAIGAGIPTLALGIRNQIAFGGFWRTGYGLSNEPAHFGLNYFVSYFVPYLRGLFFDGLSLIFLLGVIGMIILCCTQDTRKVGVLFILLVVPITVLYMAYCWRPDPQSMRFLLPTFPIYIIVTVWCLKLVTDKNLELGLVSAVMLLSFTIWWGYPRSIRSMHHLKINNSVLARITQVLEKRVEPGSIVIANEGVNQHLDFIGSWRLIDTSILRIASWEAARQFNFRKSMSRQRILRNIEASPRYAHLSGKQLFHAFSHDVWQWGGTKHKVYLIGSEEQIYWFKEQLSQYDKLVMIDKMELPKVGVSNSDMTHGVKPPARPSERMERFMVRRGPMGRDRIFDLFLNGEALFLVEWKRELPSVS